MNHVLNQCLARIIIGYLYHHVVRAKDIQNVVSPWELFLSNRCKIVNLLLCYCDCVIHLEAIQVNVLFSVIKLIALIKDLPCDIPMDFLSGILVLLLTHGFSPSIFVSLRVLILHIKVLIHLVGLLLKSLHHPSVSVLY